MINAILFGVFGLALAAVVAAGVVATRTIATCMINLDQRVQTLAAAVDQNRFEFVAALDRALPEDATKH